MDYQEDSLKIDLTAESPKSGDLPEEFTYLDSKGIRRAMPPGLIRRLIDVKEREEWIEKQKEDEIILPQPYSSAPSSLPPLSPTEFKFEHPREFINCGVSYLVPTTCSSFEFDTPTVMEFDQATGRIVWTPAPPMQYEDSAELQRKYEEEQYRHRRYDWLKVKGGNGDIFYWNRKTKESQWDPPTDSQGRFDETAEILDYSWPVITID